MILLILSAAIFAGLAIAPARRADTAEYHLMHATNCPECES